MLRSYLIKDTLLGMAWQVDFFLDERGEAPVEAYLKSLPIQHRAKTLALIKMLEQHGPSLPFPYSSQVRGKLRELRTQQGKETKSPLFRRHETGICPLAWHREAKRETARGRDSHCGSAVSIA